MYFLRDDDSLLGRPERNSIATFEEKILKQKLREC